MVQSLSSLAERQWRDYQAREPGSCFADPAFELALHDAYGLQDAVCALRAKDGDRVVGYKVGCTGPGTTSQFGMAGPIRGYLFGSELRKSGETLAASSFARLAIEGEMALRIGNDGGIETAFPIIELHHFIFRARRKTLAELVANNGFNAGVVLPDEIPPSPAQYEEADLSMSVRVNDKELGFGPLWPLDGGPQASVGWLQRHLGESGIALRPGDIVLAGTPLGLYPVDAGDHVAVYVGNRLGAECRVA